MLRHLSPDLCTGTNTADQIDFIHTLIISSLDCADFISGIVNWMVYIVRHKDRYKQGHSAEWSHSYSYSV